MKFNKSSLLNKQNSILLSLNYFLSLLFICFSIKENVTKEDIFNQKSVTSHEKSAHR